MMILFLRNALFHLKFPMTLWIFVFQMNFKHMILRSFLGPKSSPFRAKPKINLNVKTASFGSIQCLPMAVSKTSVLGPSKIHIVKNDSKFMNLKIIFLNFIWKTKIHKIMGNSQWNKAFLQNKIIIYIIQILTSLKTALKNYTWKVCVLPQQNAFGRPFSLKKHEEMFCDFAKTSGFFGESRHTKCISLGEMHIHDFSHFFSSRFFQEELQPFGTQRNRRLTDNFAWFGSIQGLEINAQTRRSGVQFRSCGPPQTRKFLALWGREQGGGSNHHTPDGLVLWTRVGGLLEWHPTDTYHCT